MGIKEAMLETVNLEAHRDFAHELGKFQLRIQAKDGKNEMATGKYVVIWRKKDSNWRLHVDIWNADA